MENPYRPPEKEHANPRTEIRYRHVFAAVSGLLGILLIGSACYAFFVGESIAVSVVMSAAGVGFLFATLMFRRDAIAAGLIFSLVAVWLCVCAGVGA